MVFVSDNQRKAVMAKLNQGSIKSDIRPQIVPLKAGGDIIGDKAPITAQERAFLNKKIRKNISEGKPVKQAIAISFSQTRRKFGNSKLLSPKDKLAVQKIRRIIPKLSARQAEELRQTVLKKIGMRNPPKIPLQNLLPLLLSTVVILAVLRAAQKQLKS